MDANRENSTQLDELARKVQSGQKEYEGLFHDTLMGHVTRVMKIKLKSISEDILADLVAITVANIWSSLGNWNPAKGTFRTWIGRIIDHKYIDYLRDETRERKYVENKSLDDMEAPAVMSEPESVESLYLKKELRDKLLVALFTNVEPIDRTIYLFRINYDLTFQELADIVGHAGHALSTKAVEQRFYKTRNLLKELLGDLLS